MQLLIISDIHGNMQAFYNITLFIKNKYKLDAMILLGDIIDYGMHSNEVVKLLQELPYPILCNIRGNHEQAIITKKYDRFSSERGKLCAQYTESVLLQDTWKYITTEMSDSGMYEFEVAGRHCLAVHGSLEDIYWKSIKPGQDLSMYQKYDYVFSGHSHLPHFFEEFYTVDDLKYRNKKKTVFINPGSAGQPRNHNPMAQFAVLDINTGRVIMEKIPYNIKKEQEAYIGQVDEFYKIRLESGV